MSPPNEVREGTMKRAPYVCVSTSGLINVKVWSFLGRILFVLSDRAWCGLQNVYRILKLINYANLCKFIQNQWKMLLLCHFLANFDSVYFILGWACIQNLHRILKFITLCKLCKFIQINDQNATSVSSKTILILYVDDHDKTWCGLQNLYMETWNWLICKFMEFKINERCYFFVISWTILILFVLW